MQFFKNNIFLSYRNNPDGKPRKKQHICHIPGCNKVYGKTSHLRAHLRWHSGERSLICNWIFCGERFTKYLIANKCSFTTLPSQISSEMRRFSIIFVAARNMTNMLLFSRFSVRMMLIRFLKVGIL